MFVYPRFPGDNSKELNNAQHHLYWYLLYTIFDRCKTTYLICDEVCNKLNKEERENLVQQTSFDHRTLQGTHDTIATAFRYIKRDGVITLFEPTTDEIHKYFNRRYKDWNTGEFGDWCYCRLTDIELVWAYHWELFFNKTVEQLTNIDSMKP